MMSILCYGDSNTWGHIAGTDNIELGLAERFGYGERWPNVLQERLGENYHVIESGLKGRNTSFDEKNKSRPSRNGLLTLPGVLDSNYPIDLVIFMLGTNDILAEFNAKMERIKDGMRRLIRYTAQSHFGPNFTAPKILLICPAMIKEKSLEIYKGFYNRASIDKSMKLPTLYEALSKENNCYFMDANDFVEVSEDDGVHLDKISHRQLGAAVASMVKDKLLK